MSAAERVQENKRDAKKAAAQQRKEDARRAEFVGFVNYKPNEAEKIEFEGWFKNTATAADDLAGVLRDGWKLGFTRDKADDIYVATIARWDSGHPSAGIILNCRTRDVLLGHLRVVFALVHVYEYDLSPYVARSNGDDLF